MSETVESRDHIPSTKFRRFLAVCVVPALIFAVSFVLRQVQGPYYQNKNYDPPYAYLLNSLNILEGYPIVHTDHPGTTQQVLGALVLKSKVLVECRLFKSCRSVVEMVANDPESSIVAIVIVANMLFAGSLLLVGWALALKRSLAFALTFQVAILASKQIFFNGLLLLNAELLLVTFMVLFCGAIALAIQSPAPTKRMLCLIGACTGVIFGAGVVTKVTCVPLALCLLMLPGGFTVPVALIGMIFSIYVCTIPIRSEMSRVIGWLSDIAIHKEHYGSGAVGVPNPLDLLRQFWGLVVIEPLPAIMMAYCLTLALNIYIKNRDLDYRAIWSRLRIPLVGGIALLAQLLMTAKHPNPRYLVPSLILTALLMAQFFSSRFLRASLAMVLCWTLYGDLEKGVGLYKDDVHANTSRLEAVRRQCLTKPFYRRTEESDAWEFGSNWCGHSYPGRALDVPCPAGSPGLMSVSKGA